MQATLRKKRPGRPTGDDPRFRLLHGLGAAVAEHGYAATTIADIVRHAGVSRRTFYEHFRDKESCFLEAYQLASAMALETALAAADAEAFWKEQLEEAISAYLAVLESQPALTRAFLLEIHAAGAQALAMRREVHDRFAEALRGLATRARKRYPELRPLSSGMALALVGGIHELVLSSLETGRGNRLRELEATSVELLARVLSPHT